MAEYVKRAAEVFAQVLEFVRLSQADVSNIGSDLAKTWTPAESAKATAAAGEERTHFLNKVPDYFVARNRRLTDLMDAMDMDPSRREELDSRWKQHTSGLADDAQRLLIPLLSGIDSPTPRAVALRWKIISEEDAFNSRLGALRVAVRWARIGKISQELGDFGKYLRGCWDTIAQQAKTLNDVQCEKVERLDSAVRSAWSDAQDRYREAFGYVDDARDELDDGVKASSLSYDKVRNALDRALSPMNRAIEALDRMARTYAETLARIRMDMAQLETPQASETGVVHRAYRDAQKEAENFAKEPSDQRARGFQSDCRDFLQEWVSALSSNPGMRDDATSFKDDLLNKTEPAIRTITDAYQAFENEWKGKFLGTMDSSRADELLASRTWADRRRNLLESETADKPATLAVNVGIYFSVPLEESYNNLANAAETKIPADSRRDEAKALVTSQRDDVLRRYRERSEAIKSVSSTLQELLRSSYFRNLLERSTVERSLRG